MNPGPTAPGPEALSIRSLRQMRPVGLGPWDPSELVRLAMCNLAGVILVGIAWYQASGQTLVRNELTWLELGILGVAVAVTGNLLWVLGGRRHVGLARVSVLPSPVRPATTAEPTGATAEPTGATAEPTGATAGTGPGSATIGATTGGTTGAPLVASARMTRYHQAGCPLVAGKAVSAATAGEHRAAGRAPCELCEP